VGKQQERAQRQRVAQTLVLVDREPAWQQRFCDRVHGLHIVQHYAALIHAILDQALVRLRKARERCFPIRANQGGYRRRIDRSQREGAQQARIERLGGLCIVKSLRCQPIERRRRKFRGVGRVGAEEPIGQRRAGLHRQVQEQRQRPGFGMG